MQQMLESSVNLTLTPTPTQPNPTQPNTTQHNTNTTQPNPTSSFAPKTNKYLYLHTDTHLSTSVIHLWFAWCSQNIGFVYLFIYLFILGFQSGGFNF